MGRRAPSPPLPSAPWPPPGSTATGDAEQLRPLECPTGFKPAKTAAELAKVQQLLWQTVVDPTFKNATEGQVRVGGVCSLAQGALLLPPSLLAAARPLASARAAGLHLHPQPAAHARPGALLRFVCSLTTPGTATTPTATSELSSTRPPSPAACLRRVWMLPAAPSARATASAAVAAAAGLSRRAAGAACERARRHFKC